MAAFLYTCTFMFDAIIMYVWFALLVKHQMEVACIVTSDLE
jgi:hypothetical protein